MFLVQYENTSASMQKSSGCSTMLVRLSAVHTLVGKKANLEDIGTDEIIWYLLGHFLWRLFDLTVEFLSPTAVYSTLS